VYAVQAVRFADHQAMLASTVEGLQHIMSKLNEVAQNYKMKINEKTKVIHENRKRRGRAI